MRKNGCVKSMTVCGKPTQGIGQRANTRMNVNRYSASGMIQINGIAAMSVVR